MQRRRTMRVTLYVILALSLSVVAAPTVLSSPSVKLCGLAEPARVVRENNGIAHIMAQNEHDLYLLQGYVHAQDRLFQMDVSRREASGTLAELVGPAALFARRAASHHWPAEGGDPVAPENFAPGTVRPSCLCGRGERFRGGEPAASRIRRAGVVQ